MKILILLSSLILVSSVMLTNQSFAVDYRDSTGYTPSWAKDAGYHSVLLKCTEMIGSYSRDGDWCLEWTTHVLDQGVENFPQSTQGTASSSISHNVSERKCIENKICTVPRDYLKYKNWDTLDDFSEISIVEFKEKINDNTVRVFVDGFGNKPLTYNLNLKTGIETHDEYTNVNRPFNLLEPVPMKIGQKIWQYFEGDYEATISMERTVNLKELELSIDVERTIMIAESDLGNGNVGIYAYDKETGVLITYVEKYQWEGKEHSSGIVLIETNMFSIPTTTTLTKTSEQSNEKSTTFSEEPDSAFNESEVTDVPPVDSSEPVTIPTTNKDETEQTFAKVTNLRQYLEIESETEALKDDDDDNAGAVLGAFVLLGIPAIIIGLFIARQKMKKKKAQKIREKNWKGDDKSTKLELSDYQNDNSLKSINQDQFKHSHYVNVLSDILEKCQTPFNIGLYGKWGVGKSSIVHMLKEKLETEEYCNKYKYVEVNAWGLSGESLQQGILEEINSQLGKKDGIPAQEIEDKLYNIKEVKYVNRIKTLIPAAAIFAVIIAVIIVIAIVVDGISDLFDPSIIIILIPLVLIVIQLFLSSSKRITPKTISTLQFNKIYKKLVETQKGKKFIVVIDNLDRCDDKIAVDLLGIIQTFMVEPNCINILTCDDDAIIKHLRGVKGTDYTERDGNEFLSKFFQLTLRIPPFIGENLEKYADKLINKRSITFHDSVKSILISGAIENPRKINQFMNNAVALYRLAKYKEDDGKLTKGIITDHTDVLVKMIIIRHEWPLFHKELEKNPRLLQDAAERQQWTKLNYRQINLQMEGLEKFLDKTMDTKVDDAVISAFLRLNQESYSVEPGIDKFSKAFISNDVPTVKKSFEILDMEQQNQYVKKLVALTNGYADKNDNSVLLNCTYSIITILGILEDESLKSTLILLLKKHLSTKLLGHLGEYVLLHPDLFSYLEDMENESSDLMYSQILVSVINDTKINKDLVNRFFDNGKIISEKTMNRLDHILTKFTSTNEHIVLDYVVELCTKYDWSKINLAKPSQLLSHIINNMKFDSSEIDNKRISTYVSIHDKISEREQERFVEHLRLKTQEYSNPHRIFPTELLELMSSAFIWKSEALLEYLIKLYKSFSESLEHNSDAEQKKIIIKLLIKFESKLNQLSPSDKYRINLDESLGVFLKTGDLNTLRWFNTLSENSEIKYLNSEPVLNGYLQNVENTALDNVDILKFVLDNTLSDNRGILFTKFAKIIDTGELSKYQTILNILVENPSDHSVETISPVILSCKSLSSKMKHPEYLALDDIIIKLHKSLYHNDVKDIYQRAIKLIQNDDPVMQDDGLNLLSVVNDRTNSFLVGIKEAIDQAKKFINENNELLACKYMDFIMKYSPRLNKEESKPIGNLIKLSLSEDKSSSIHEMGIRYVDKNIKFMKDAGNNIIKLVTTSDDNIREMCRIVLVDHKDKLSHAQRKRIKALFG